MAIPETMAQSVSHDLRNHLSAIYSNVEFMSEPRTTQLEREKLLQDVHAVIQDMTGMLDSLLLLAKTGQTLHPCWASLNKMVEHAACMVRAHPDARNVDLVIQDGASVAVWMDCTKLVALRQEKAATATLISVLADTSGVKAKRRIHMGSHMWIIEPLWKQAIRIEF
ncbi:histidine kinase dimerization/phospho-acceptor domain-containing protein [Tunturiibacter gelidiferens]|uniref:histidine kinase dimerization/phospho-acceptor domain-containing protein n=1 Tax=Tunturiibacter gelidiferens TaxID=3069689 RepID=UPI003D9B4537